MVMSKHTKYAKYVQRYERGEKVAARAENAYDFFADFDGFPTKIIAPGAAVGFTAGALAGSTMVEHGAFAFLGVPFGAFVGLLLYLCALLGTGSWYYLVEWVLTKVNPPSVEENLLWRLEQHKTNPDLAWLHADIVAALPGAQRAARTAQAVRKADKGECSAETSKALDRCSAALQTLERRCRVEAEKAQLVKIVPTENGAKKTPSYLYISDAEELSRVAEVAETVAKFREETLRQNQPST